VCEREREREREREIDLFKPAQTRTWTRAQGRARASAASQARTALPSAQGATNSRAVAMENVMLCVGSVTVFQAGRGARVRCVCVCVVSETCNIHSRMCGAYPCTCAFHAHAHMHACACIPTHMYTRARTCTDAPALSKGVRLGASVCVSLSLSLSLSLSVCVCMCVSVSYVYTSTYTNAPNFTPTHVPTRTCALTHTDTDAHNAHPTERAGASVYSHICDCENCMSQVEISLNPTAQTLTLKPSHSNLALPHRDALA
jgi:hypothetical protein